MAVEFLLSHGIATWENLLWSFQATAHVDRKSVEELLRIMEEAWPEEVAGLRKLSVNQLIGLMATERDRVYSLKTTNNKADEPDSLRTRAVYWEGGSTVDHVFGAKLLSNWSFRPVHYQVMATEATRWRSCSTSCALLRSPPSVREGCQDRRPRS